ncbi:retrotransposable element Tf2 [Tanacetum coccineum]
MSSAYHPQTDGQIEVVNKCLDGYLRCMTREKPKDWVKWFPLAEYWYNTNFHSSINTTPYEVDKMKSQADKKRTEREFKEEDWVYLKLQPYRQMTLRQGRQNKFSSNVPCFTTQSLSDVIEMGQFPQCDDEGLIAATPIKLLERRITKQGNRAVVFGLIQ